MLARANTTAPFIRIVAEDGIAYPINSEPGSPSGSRTAGAAQSTAPAAPATLSDDGYGKRGRCKACGHGFYGCICGPWPDDDELTHVEDMKRIMPGLFETRVPPLPSGWSRVVA